MTQESCQFPEPCFLFRKSSLHYKWHGQDMKKWPIYSLYSIKRLPANIINKSAFFTIIFCLVKEKASKEIIIFRWDNRYRNGSSLDQFLAPSHGTVSWPYLERLLSVGVSWTSNLQMSGLPWMETNSKQRMKRPCLIQWGWAQLMECSLIFWDWGQGEWSRCLLELNRAQSC